MAPVDAAEGRAHRGRLVRPIAPGGPALDAAAGSQHGVACCVDEGLGFDETKSLDITDDGAIDRMAIYVGVDYAREIANFNSRLDAVLVEHTLETFRIEGNPAIIVRDPVFGRNLGAQESALVHC